MASFREQVIPLFPLSRVLFPKMILPLHIFEERYKSMIGFCLEEDIQFGVIASDSLSEGSIGCTAKVHKVVHRYDDGKMDLLAMGMNRFRLVRTIIGKPYPEGVVHFFNDLPEDDSIVGNIQRLLESYRVYINRLGLKEKQKEDFESIVSDIKDERELSYIIGQTIGLDADGQRKLLSDTSGEARIGRLLRELGKQEAVYHLARRLFEKDNFDPGRN